MKKTLLWLLLSVAAMPAYADPLDTNTGDPEQYVRPPAITFPIADTIPGCSIAAGYHALQFLPANTPAAFCDIAMGFQAMKGKMTAAAINNIGLGFDACANITTGSGNICLGSGGSAISGPGAGITSYSGNIMVGSGSGSNYGGGGASNNNIVFENEGVVSGNQGSNNVLFDVHGGWIGSNSVLLAGDTGYQAQYACNYFTLIAFNAGRLNACNGGAENSVILIGNGASTAPNTNDVATSTSNTALAIGGLSGTGGNKPGTGDTVAGFNALSKNAQDNAGQAAFGFDSLFTSNVASARNTAFGYQSCKTVTTGTNNLCLGYNAASTTLTTGSNNILIGTSSSVTTPASGTSGMLNIGGLIYGHLAGTSAPTVSSCGSSPAADAHANDASGTITAGSGTLASCTITFASAYTTWNHCKVTSQTGALAGFAYSYSTSAITITGTSITSDVFDYVCDGY